MPKDFHNIEQYEDGILNKISYFYNTEYRPQISSMGGGLAQSASDRDAPSSIPATFKLF